SLQGDLPISPVTDLAVKDRDLVAATQGRGFWILDDLTLLHQLEPGAAVDGPILFAPRDSHRLVSGFTRTPSNAGANPPAGALVHFYLPPGLLDAHAGGAADDGAAEGAEGADDAGIHLAILDGDGELIRTFTPKSAAADGAEADDDAVLELEDGLNRFAWDLRYPAPDTFDGMVVWNRVGAGPKAVPGTYRARLRVGDVTREVSFEVIPDPRSGATAEDFRKQFDFLRDVGAKLSAVNGAVGQIRDVRGQVEAILGRLDDGDAHAAVRADADALLERVKAIEEKLYQTQNRSRQDPLNFPIRLNDKLGNLIGHADGGDFAPAASLYAVRDELYAQVDAELQALDGIWTDDLPALDAAIRGAEVPAIALDPADGSGGSVPKK
ncbi:MAG: glycosyl hydrolase, partial [Acidobacteriota bacterium]